MNFLDTLFANAGLGDVLGPLASSGIGNMLQSLPNSPQQQAMHAQLQNAYGSPVWLQQMAGMQNAIQPRPRPEPSPDDFDLWCADSRAMTFEEWCVERFGAVIDPPPPEDR